MGTPTSETCTPPILVEQVVENAAEIGRALKKKSHDLEDEEVRG